MSEPWLPEGWAHPTRVELSTGHHLRPIHPDDTELDMPAVMGSRERLWAIYGEAWGWPPATLTAEKDREDLQYHRDEELAHRSFNYALFDADETELIGCVYLDPTDKPGADADISWWVRDEYAGTPVEAALDALVPRWVAEDWPLRAPRYVGRDLSWAQWLALPDQDEDPGSGGSPATWGSTFPRTRPRTASGSGTPWVGADRPR
ncbi:GNAT family N-acetyltransferase [Nocardioides sp. cx-173]|uniref:GNAT family N-acetyltransferase n=1 Tax=Nocardioides sp. cx-173 TaxID=2898796 RepID=UPI001E2F1901|nr:GNAT family N-acetyltransferase [Nocardioides sp. cx-173]MCD4527265.1 GNAT family N-acetyltransferase [Nocardioides sp. cx-173]UGB40358.1 GNAT family N-acetyltransferase [Nocardioides sp. cx-173]